ncbi:MarR family winged helix-turn-helix transcriptional regulator [Propionibacteriaceae bacterium Y1700]|uniref:MarR family winged helix-turn-helix transcriptional regulator n=1 Tax=Microlunatus sp. Y1700 TaxID=3418487 RepID=UPI003DA798E9
MSTDLAIDLLVTSARFVRYVRRRANTDTSVAEWRAVVLLDEHGPLRVSEFAALDRLSQPTATVMLKRLVAQGIAGRTPDPQDGRASLAELTDKGRQHLAALRQDAGRNAAPLLTGLSADEREVLRRATQLLAGLVDEHEAPHGSNPRPGKKETS